MSQRHLWAHIRITHMTHFNKNGADKDNRCVVHDSERGRARVGSTSGSLFSPGGARGIDAKLVLPAGNRAKHAKPPAPRTAPHDREYADSQSLFATMPMQCIQCSAGQFTQPAMGGHVHGAFKWKKRHGHSRPAHVQRGPTLGLLE